MVERIRSEIFESIAAFFGITVKAYSEIELGYMNLKWRIEADIGSFFVKQFNKIRYPKQLLEGLEISMSQHDLLHKKGIPSPKLFSYRGKYVLETSSGERFVLMELCEGNVIKPGSANERQMYHLGQITGAMHEILNANNDPNQPLHWQVRTKESMVELWNKRWLDANLKACHQTIAALEIQRQIIDETDLDIFSGCEQGWGHWDLFVDNILFHSDSVSAILDFDRVHYVYPEFDLSRSILSCALDNNVIQMEKVNAFAQGYREYRPLTAEKMVRSMRLSWWKEAEWVWVEKAKDTASIKRFREENKWIGSNWRGLDSMFASL